MLCRLYFYTRSGLPVGTRTSARSYYEGMRDFVINGLRVTAGGAGEELSGDIAVVCDFSRPIDLVAEARGEKNMLGEICALSEKSDLTLVFGTEVLVFGERRLSAVIAHRGALADVADGCSVSSPYVAAKTVKIYRVGSVKFAVLLGGDARVGFIMKKIASACDFAVAVEPEPSSGSSARVKYLSAKLSLPVLYVSPSETFFAGAQLYRNTLS